MSVTRVQRVSISATSGTSLSVTPASTPASGNLLVVKQYVTGTITTLTGPAGFTLGAVSTLNTGGKIGWWWKRSNGTESGALTFTSDVATTYAALTFYEWDAGTPWSVSPVAASGQASATSTSLTVPATGATSQAESLVLAAIGVAGSANGFLGTWTNGFAQELTFENRVTVGSKLTTAIETPSTNESWTTSRAARGAIIAFSVPSAPVNVAPTANAGPDQANVEPWTTVTLTGSGSTDPDGTIASYAWTQTAGTAVTLSGSGSNRTFTAPGTLAGTTLTFSLTVTDNGGATSTADTVNVTVLPAAERVMIGGTWVPAKVAIV